MPSDPGPRAEQPLTLAALRSPDPSVRGRVLKLGERLVIGRSGHSGLDLAIDDRLLSRRHATIERAPDGKYELSDHESSNGSFVDGERVKRAPLAVGSIVRLGVSLFEISNDDELEKLEESPSPVDCGSGDVLIGRCLAFRELISRIDALAEGSAPVLIIGESGTGKELLARRLHLRSRRRGRLVVVDSASIPTATARAHLFGVQHGDGPEASFKEGYLGRAADGTVLLDAVERLPLEVQDLFLEALRDKSYSPIGTDDKRPFEARLCAASASEIEPLVGSGEMREELYKMLTTEVVRVPPLRERRSDIPILARYFLTMASPERKFDWSPTCLEKLLLYGWPLNARELRAVMQRLTLLDAEVSVLRTAHLPQEIRRPFRDQGLDALRASAITVHTVPGRDELVAALEKCGGSLAAVAKLFAADRRLVARWLQRHDLTANDYRK